MATRIKAVFVLCGGAVWTQATDGMAYMIGFVEYLGNVYVEDDGRIQPPPAWMDRTSSTLAELGWVKSDGQAKDA